MYDNVPQELKNLKHWCCFKLQKRGEKLTKIPIDANTGNPGKSNDESTWSDFDTALNAINKFRCNGIGIYFKYPYFGIDIDDVPTDIKRYKNNDHENNIVSEFIEMMGSYAEISVSGNGIHIISKGILPEGGRRKGKVEMYSEGRFFVVSDNIIGSYTNISDDSDYGKINFLHSKYINSGDVSVKNIPSDSLPGSDLSVEEIIRIASNSKNGMRFEVLLNGDWSQFYTSQSEADMAFANDLAFWSNRDFNKMDSIFRSSSLYRDKYDRKQNNSTYGAETLNKAINDCMNVFTPRERDEEFNLYLLDDNVKKITKKYFSYDDTGNAQRFENNYGDAVRYSYIRKGWYYYNGKRWAIDQEGKIKSLADKTIEKMKDETVYVPKDGNEEMMKKAFDKHVKATRSSRGKTSMLKETEHLLSIKPEEFDSDKNLFNVQNGYLDLTTGILKDHDKSKFFTKISNVEYTDKSDCPMWMDFLDTIFDGDKSLINYIQRAVGYSLSGSTEEQIMFILHGNGRNGKSVFLDIITEIFGNYSINIQPQTIMVKQQTSGANSDIARLSGARFVTSTEPNDGVRFDEGLVKQLTGGDKVTARFLYGDEFDFNPEFKLWMATNHKPIIRGTDDGIWRRLAIIPFTVQIPLDKVDKRLTSKLKREMKAILNWISEGYLLWRESGLQEPECIKLQRGEYRKEMDVTECFVDDCCVRKSGEREKSSDLYRVYASWAKENNQHIMSSTRFGKELSNKFQKISSNGIYYVGVELKREFNNEAIRLNLN